MNDIALAYFEGFMTKCSEYGLDPEQLIKSAGGATVVEREVAEAAKALLKTKPKIVPRHIVGETPHFRLPPPPKTVLHVPRSGERIAPTASHAGESGIPSEITSTPIPTAPSTVPTPAPGYNPTTEKIKEIAEGGTAEKVTTGGAYTAKTGPKTVPTPKPKTPVEAEKPVGVPEVKETVPEVATKDPVETAGRRIGGAAGGLAALSLGGYGATKAIDATAPFLSTYNKLSPVEKAYVDAHPDLKAFFNTTGSGLQGIKNIVGNRPLDWDPPVKNPTWGK